jgi:hypothetical protein
MNETVVVDTALSGSGEAGTFIGSKIASGLRGPPDALIVFAPPEHDYRTLLRAIDETCHPKILIGGSSVGGFTSDGYLGRGAASAVAIRSTDMSFRVGVGRNLGENTSAAARDMVAPFAGLRTQRFIYHSAIVLVDALVGHADAFIDDVIVATGGTYQLFGGGAADGARMSRAHLFHGTEVVSDAAVGLEILSNKPLGVGLCQGWQPTSAPMRVTAADGRRVLSINSMPALEAFQEHAERTGQTFDPAAPIPFFLDNILGITTGKGYRFRVPVAVNQDGSVTCAAEVPSGSTVTMMATTATLAGDAADQGVRKARAQLGELKPKAAIFFDCLASEARMQLGFGFDPRALAKPLATRNFAGFSTCGQIVRAEGDFNGFQNCTAVVCVIPE